VKQEGLFPAIEPYKTGYLKVSDLHEIYWEECGNPQGVPIVFIHGGPGAGISDSARKFFDPSFYRIILFDQRGAPKSRPFGEMRENTTFLLVEDLEKLREYLGVTKWILFGGSWGSTLSLTYAQTHPERCLGMILRGIWLFRDEDIKWFFEAPQKISPDHWRRFIEFLPEDERADYFENYYKRVMDEDPAIHMPAAKSFARFEADNSTLIPYGEYANIVTDEKASLGIARCELFYMKNNRFEDPNHLLKSMKKLENIPMIMVHGRYDYVCSIEGAFLIQDALPRTKLVIVNDAGHSAYEPGIKQALIDATEEFKLKLKGRL
jgi:proline iminopeptidase